MHPHHRLPPRPVPHTSQASRSEPPAGSTGTTTAASMAPSRCSPQQSSRRSTTRPSPESPNPQSSGREPGPIQWSHRLIPACAGSTAVSRSSMVMIGAHPRVRGEHLSKALAQGNDEGSSPRARGALRLAGGKRRRNGLIPACAGSTPASAHPLSWTGAHPRVRGEHPTLPFTDADTWGSFPRARGAPCRWGALKISVRLIPACAGSTRCTATSP